MTYTEITTLVVAHKHIESMLSTPLGQKFPEVMLESIFEDAYLVCKRTDGSPVEGAFDSNLGASLVMLALNQKKEESK